MQKVFFNNFNFSILFQRIFEALTPTFQTQHPVSVVNHLHSGSLDRVESKNTLKKEKSLDLQEKLVINQARD